MRQWKPQVIIGPLDYGRLRYRRQHAAGVDKFYSGPSRKIRSRELNYRRTTSTEGKDAATPPTGPDRAENGRKTTRRCRPAEADRRWGGDKEIGIERSTHQRRWPDILQVSCGNDPVSYFSLPTTQPVCVLRRLSQRRPQKPTGILPKF